MDWEALERADEDRLIERITTGWKLVARDHKSTFRMLALLPPVERIIISDTDSQPDHTDTNPNDPTGEAAINGSDAIRRREWYSQLLAEVDARVTVLDSIRRQMMHAPAAEATTNDDEWCKNCALANVWNTRRNGRHHCWWCAEVRQVYGALPPPNIIKVREETGDPARIAKALDEWRKPKRQKSVT